MTGKVHSFQSLGGADGPGVRYIVFLQGCPYTCPYCHNPETRAFSGGEEYTAEDVIAKVERFKPYFEGNGGGLTVSGGEPLMQAEFVAELFALAHEKGINTCLDTAGVAMNENVRKVLEHTDTVLCDIKFPYAEISEKKFGIGLGNTIKFLENCRDMGVSIIVRHVVVPGLTDTEENVSAVRDLVYGIYPKANIELLPFKKLCIEKYKDMGISFPLEATPECKKETIERLNKLL